MSPAERSYLAKLQRRAAVMQKEEARRLLTAYDIIRASLSEAELARAINAGQVDALIAELLSDQNLEPAFASLRQLIDRQLLDAAQQAVGDMPLRMRVTLNLLNPRVIQAARSLDSVAIDTLKSDVRETVRQVVTRGIQEGIGPRQVAREIRASVGLSPSQERWVANFRRELRAGSPAALRRSLGRNQLRDAEGRVLTRSGHGGGFGLGTRDLTLLRSGKQPTAEQIERMVAAYRKKLEALNAEAHTRTIALQAQKKASRLSWESSIERGIVARADLRRTWVTVGDSRVRPHHREMNGQTVGFDEPFSNGQMEPGENEWNCRCVARIWVQRQRLALLAA